MILASMAAAVLLAQAAPAPSALLSNSARETLYKRTVQLMEAATVATPELARAGAPLIEDARQAVVNLHAQGWNESYDYRFVTAVRIFLELADAVPKPFPFPEAARAQMTELRDNLLRAQASFTAALDHQARSLHSPDPADLARFVDDNIRLGPPKPGNARVVFFGDSITDFWRLNEYFPGRDFPNRGISGQTTGEMLQRFQADVVSLQPAAVVILAGTNDIARGVPLTAIEANLTSMFELASFNKIRVIMASLLPVNDFNRAKDPNYERSALRPPATIVQLNDWISRLCREKGCTYLDYYSKMVDAQSRLQAGLSDDGLHPNSSGYRIMAPLVEDAITRSLGPAQPARRKRRLPF